MKKTSFTVIKRTPYKNGKGVWYLVKISGQTFVVHSDDWASDTCVESPDTLTLHGDIERISVDRLPDSNGEIKKGTKLCPKLDF